MAVRKVQILGVRVGGGLLLWWTGKPQTDKQLSSWAPNTWTTGCWFGLEKDLVMFAFQVPFLYPRPPAAAIYRWDKQQFEKQIEKQFGILLQKWNERVLEHVWIVLMGLKQQTWSLVILYNFAP